jgi:predicted DCC family thiol-disulfide oxidoreductase YuxK
LNAALENQAQVVINPVVLYDGVCGLCNRLTQFLLRHDHKDRLRFASLQSNFAEVVLKRNGLDSKDLDTVCVVLNYGAANERVLTRSEAILYLGKELGGIWSIGAWGRILPRWFRDGLYKLVARNRYRVFGKYDTCMLPEPRHRGKFLD